MADARGPADDAVLRGPADDDALRGPAGHAEERGPAGADAAALGGGAASDRDRPVAWVQVAVDAAGAGGDRPYTYHLTAAMADIVAGEAVLVDFGRRRALGVVLERLDVDPEVPTKAVASRVRAEGPLLPPLSLALAASISATYLAPPAATIRAMLPPRMLERVELVVERAPGAVDDGEGGDPWRADVLTRLEAGPRPAADLVGDLGRAAGLRRLHDLEDRGIVHLAWELRAAGVGPRYERWLRLSEPGREAAPAAVGSALRAGSDGAGRPAGEGIGGGAARRLGPRQLAALADIAAGVGGVPAARIAATHGSGVPAALVRRGLVEVEIRERGRRPLAGRAAGRRGGRPADADLSVEQAAAVEAIGAAIEARDARPLLLDGVTGGGRTAVYVEAIAASLAAGRPALVLVPEIALATPLLDRIRADLDAEVAVLHSALGEGERTDEWRRIRAGGADVVVGTRLAVMAPLEDIGVIVVDEEHDPAYKSDRMPRLQARDVAIRLGALAGAAVVLGSATPAVETFGRALEGVYGRVTLPERLAGAPPSVEVVDLRSELAAGNRGLLSRRLDEAIAALDVANGDRAILVMNRRGAASVVLCRDCGRVETCPDCDRPLVYHEAAAVLRCHHCGASAAVPRRCRGCGSARIRYLGGGTERIEREVTDLFPGLRVGRLDRDVVERKGEAVRIVDAFTEGRLDVLVGTSLVTKGLDIPEVTLVGVVSADVALNLPDERAAERTLQLIVQAIGRAGRGERPGHAIVQTYLPEHPVMRAVATGDVASFYASELALRRVVGSPPFGRLVKLTIALPDRDAGRRAALEMAAALRDRAMARGSATAVIGPAPAYVARRAGRWRWNVALRGPDPVALLDGAPPSPWAVDVDPESLL